MKDIIWICPQCGYKVPDIGMKSAKYDFLCPGCKVQPFSKFVRTEHEVDEVTQRRRFDARKGGSKV